MSHETRRTIAVPNEPSDDGRNINTEMGALSGEAAQQAAVGTRYNVALRSQAFPYTPSQQPSASPSYYDQPMLKEPVWETAIPTYFYVGGMAGATATLAAASQLIAPNDMRSLIRRSHWIGTAGAVVSAGLLIYDLGRPMRFINMLRVIRVTSPMSVGSWILSFFSTSIGAAAVLPYGPRVFRPLVYPVGVASGVFGLGLAGYTGVLLAQTAVPLWQQSYCTLPVLFISSGTAASAAILEFFSWNAPERKAIQHFGLMGQVAELATATLLQRNASRVERVGRPLNHGLSGTLWNTAKVLTVAGIVLSVLPGKHRGKHIASGLLGTAASLCTRFGIFYAGKASARDPRASFELQRHTRHVE